MSLCIAGTSVSAGLSVPCVVRCTIQSTYAAARMMPPESSMKNDLACVMTANCALEA